MCHVCSTCTFALTHPYAHTLKGSAVGCGKEILGSVINNLRLGLVGRIYGSNAGLSKFALKTDVIESQSLSIKTSREEESEAVGIEEFGCAQGIAKRTRSKRARLCQDKRLCWLERVDVCKVNMWSVYKSTEALSDTQCLFGRSLVHLKFTRPSVKKRLAVQFAAELNGLYLDSPRKHDMHNNLVVSVAFKRLQLYLRIGEKVFAKDMRES
jgi:hypothetical protein